MTPPPSLCDTVRAIAAGRLTAEAATRDCLDRIERDNPAVDAWAFVNQAAIDTARMLDRGPARGLLHGAPIGVKDVIDTADMPTTYGSALYACNRPPADAACVAIARGEGAIVLGKTISTEFAFVAPGPTRNPHNLAHTPGGSSSGSAAAVAAGMVPVAFGTQTAGSVIRPASFCGIVGYKPSFGLIDRTGVKTLAANFDTVGILARSVADVALMAAAASGRPALADIAPLSRSRIGFYRGPQWERAAPAVQAATARATGAAEAKGAIITDIDAGGLDADYLDLHEAVMDWDLLRAFSYERLFALDRLAPKTREGIASSLSRASVERYDRACRGMQQARAELPRLFGDCDVLLTPAAPGEAPAGLASTGDPVFNRGWTMLHVPCITVPAGRGDTGLPIGVQIVGQFGEDAKMLAVAALIEAALRDAAA